MRSFLSTPFNYVNLSNCFYSVIFLLFTASLSAEECSPVFDGAKIFTSFECINDSTVLISDSNKKNSYGWQYSNDSTKDGVSFGQVGGGDFEIYGMALNETQEYVYIVINSNLALQGFTSSRALDGNIGWADVFINFGNLDFKSTSEQSGFFGIRFASSNDSLAPKVGVYGQVSAKSVTAENAGFITWDSYRQYVINKGQIPVLGDFGAQQNYYSSDISLNVINNHNYLGDIEFVDLNKLKQLKFKFDSFCGKTWIAFRFKKRLIVDECGVFGGDGSSCRDCNGVACGLAKNDQCGVCNGDGTSCLDCNGTPFGSSVIDQCGVCGGDGTSCLDCTGTPFGNKVIDQCGVCDGDGTSCLDCAGNVNGQTHFDQCGVCGGDGTSCLDCQGVPNGQAMLDQCGVCNGDGSSCIDCEGQPFGTAKLDPCGVCNGNGTSCLDCAGEANGKAKEDRCGVCNGDGMSCINCEETEHTETLFFLDGAGASLKHLAYGIARELKNKNKNKKYKKQLAQRIQKIADQYHTSVWTLAWQLPDHSIACEASLFCVEVSNTEPFESYQTQISKFAKFVRLEARKLKHLVDSKEIRKVIKHSMSIEQKATSDLASIPKTITKCSS